METFSQVFSKMFLFFCFYGIINHAIAKNDTTKNLKITGIALPSHEPQYGWYLQGGLVGLFRTIKNDTNLRPSNIYLFGLFSQYKQYRLSNGGDVFFKNENYYLHYWLYFSYLPEYFYGIGNKVSPEVNESIRYHIVNVDLMLLRRIYKKLFIGPVFKIEKISNLKYLKSGLFEQSGLINQTNYLVIVPGLVFRYDTRDQVTSSFKGYFTELSVKRSIPVTGENFHFTELGVDLRVFLPLFRYKRDVLAFQFLSKGATGNIPFRLFPNINARAYHPNLYRENALWSFQSEYRFCLWRWLFVSAFGGVSQISQAFSEFSHSPVFINGGGGLRIRVSEKYNTFLRIELGFGKNASNFYVAFYDAF